MDFIKLKSLRNIKGKIDKYKYFIKWIKIEKNLKKITKYCRSLSRTDGKTVVIDMLHSA